MIDHHIWPRISSPPFVDTSPYIQYMQNVRLQMFCATDINSFHSHKVEDVAQE